MTDESDSDCDTIQKVSSVTLPPMWEEVPDNVDFIFKVKLNGVGGKWTKLGLAIP